MIDALCITDYYDRIVVALHDQFLHLTQSNRYILIEYGAGYVAKIEKNALALAYARFNLFVVMVMIDLSIRSFPERGNGKSASPDSSYASGTNERLGKLYCRASESLFLICICYYNWE